MPASVSSDLERVQQEDARERLSFEQQPTVCDFTYGCIPLPVFKGDYPGIEVRDRMLKAKEAAEDQYGVTFSSAETLPDTQKPLYFMTGPVNIADERAIDNLAMMLRIIRSRQPNARINLANYFSSDSAPKPEEVEGFDAENHCNTIYADELIMNGFRAVTAEDLLDNVVCETIRTKYQAVRDTSHEASLRLAEGKIESADTIARLAEVFMEYRLWHRAPTDGAILIRDSNDSLLISQTQSSKPVIAPKRFSVVTGYEDLGLDQIFFAGDRLPSSDSPELIRLMENIKDDGSMEVPKLVVHFHHPSLTRSGKFSEHVTEKEIEYGKFESGDEIYFELKRKDTNWLVLKNHGFIWSGNTVEEFEKFVKDITS